MKGYHIHESFWADFSLYFKVFRNGIIIGLILQAVILIFLTRPYLEGIEKEKFSKTNTPIAYNYVFKYWFNEYFPQKIEVESELRELFLQNRYVPSTLYNRVLNFYSQGKLEDTKQKLQNILWLSLVAYLLAFSYIFYFNKKGKTTKQEIHVRGAEMLSVEEMTEKMARVSKNDKLKNIKVGKIVIPNEMEPKHFLILGTTGSGKSVLINQIFRQVNERKNRAIVYDLKGEFIAKQYRPGDYIFSPFDQRTIHWSLFNEIRQYPDFEVISKSLYVAPEPRDEYWYNCAKDVFRAGLVYLKLNNKTSNRDICKFFAQTIEGLISCLKTLPKEEQGGLKHISNPENQNAATILSVLQERIAFFNYMVDMKGDFSFRNFISNEEETGNIFILNVEQYKILFKPLMTLVIDIIIRETLSLKDKLDRRIFFIVDEIGSLYRLDSLLDLLTIGRSKGACIICSNQDLGRIENAYGQQNMATFVNNFNTSFTLRINEPKSCDFLSQSIGEREVVKKSESLNMSGGSKGGGSSRGLSEQDKVSRLVMPSEFVVLEPFEAIIKISGFGITKMFIPKIFYKSEYAEFEMKQYNMEDRFGSSMGYNSRSGRFHYNRRSGKVYRVHPKNFEKRKKEQEEAEKTAKEAAAASEETLPPPRKLGRKLRYRRRVGQSFHLHPKNFEAPPEDDEQEVFNEDFEDFAANDEPPTLHPRKMGRNLRYQRRTGRQYRVSPQNFSDDDD